MNQGEAELTETLFHYTDAAGVVGILRSGKLWATDSRFLNDAQESDYGLDYLASAVLAAPNPPKEVSHWAHKPGGSEHFARYLESVAYEFKSGEFGVYVACFCESGDLLSQWRAYGRDHGYSIEIDLDTLKRSVTRLRTYPPATRLTKVRYGRAAAEDVATEAIEVVSQFNGNHPGVKAHYAALHLNSMLASIKNPNFEEEKEWRLVAAFEIFDESPHAVLHSDREPTLFRATPIAIVPYIELSLPHEAIQSIRIGPGNFGDVREAGVRRLLRTLGSDATVLRSDVPLRL
jgi:hypothetical protein